jgi:uncharacterized protein (DUF305 family)
MPCRLLVITAVFLASGATVCVGQSAADSVPIIQPGAPGQANKTLTPETAAAAPRRPSDADVRFMQGMIMHHSQAVEMTELLKTRGEDAAVRELGDKISVSQTDEMRYMKQWLQDRGLPIEMSMPMADMGGMDMKDMPGMDMPAMPGMLTAAQMKTLRAARGRAFDHLFLTGMIQHHTGALTMVKDLFATPGAGQDPQLFDFSNDVDNTQQAEIDIMKGLLKKEKR